MKKHQIKSSWYYTFWGIMAASVVAGQLYVGTGYHKMSETIEQTFKEYIMYSEWKDRNRLSL